MIEKTKDGKRLGKKMKSLIRNIAGVVGIVAAIGLATSANAIQFTLSEKFTGPGNPSGSPVVTLTDAGGGGVNAVFDLTGLSGSEFVSKWYLNLGLTSLSGVGFSVLSKTGAFNDPSFDADFDDYSPANGEVGKFDIELEFSTSNSRRFGADEILYAHFSGVTAADFLALSTGGTAGAFHSAAHIQAIGTSDQSAKVGDAPPPPQVPDSGATLLLLGAGLLGVAIGRRAIGR